MSSRDGSGQSGNTRRPAPRSYGSSNTPESYDIDPAEIDRYLSGQPQRTSSSTRSTSSGRDGGATPEQLDRLRRMVQTPDSGDPSGSTTPSRRPPTTSYRETVSDTPPARTTASSARRPPRYDEVYQETNDRSSAWSNEPVDYYDDYPGQWDEEGDPEIAGNSGARRSRPTMPELPRLTIPRAVLDAPILTDRAAIASIILCIVSLIGMAILVSNRITSLPPEIATHVSASGVLGDFAARNVIWRIPLLALMLTLMSFVIGVFAARFERFASRLVLASAVLVQFLSWVALIRIF